MRETRLEFDEDPEEPGEPGWADRVDAVVSQQWQKLLDLSVPYIGRRWAISALVACVYCVRAYLLKGWYIVSYGLAIYQLSLLIGFLTPQDEPDAGPGLPSKGSDEFRPFVRRVPEFKFWCVRLEGCV